MAERRERILDYLSECNKELYRSLPPNLVKAAHDGLANVRRGQSIRLVPFNKNFIQTDLDHTITSLEIGHEINREYPDITRDLDLDFTEVQTMTHDLGETYANEGIGIGDIAICGPERDSDEGTLQKKREPKVVLMVMFPMIPNPVIKNRLCIAYRRYIRRHPNDPESQFTNFIDKMEGTTREGLVGIFGVYRDFGFDDPPLSLIAHLEETLPKMMTYACNLARLLPKKGQVELNSLVRKEFGRLEEAGYEELAHYARLFYEPLILHPYYNLPITS